MENLFGINQLIEIEVPKGNINEGKYNTRIEDIIEEGILIAMPIFQGRLILLTPDNEIILWIMKDSAAYACRCKVIKRLKEPIPLILLSTPVKIDKIQRRKFYRLDAKIPLNLAIINETQNIETENLSFIDIHTIDISGGGLSFIYKKEFIPKGQKVIIKLNIVNEELIFFGKIVWVKEPDNLINQDKNLYGIEYLNISEKTRDKIIQWIFTRQMELRRKGLI